MQLKQRFWPILAIVTVSLIVAASISWIFKHPYGTSWDEAYYFNQVQADMKVLETGGVTNVAKAFLLTDRTRPPAYRFFADSFSYLFGFSPEKVRLLSMAFFIASLVFIYLGMRCITGLFGSVYAIVFICLCPAIIFPIMVFGTEYCLYLAIGATLYFLLASLDQEEESLRNWVGLGLSLGLGALSKATFLLIGGPILLLSFIISWRKILIGPSPKFLLKATLLGILIALPWWILNVHHAFELATYARNFVRHSIGPPSFETWVQILSGVANSVVGLPLTILVLLTIILSILGRADNIETRKNRFQKTVLWICFLSGIPTIVSFFSSTNNNLRYLTPVVILFAVGLGVLADRTQRMRVPLTTVSAIPIFLGQLIMIVLPSIHPIIFPVHQLRFERPPWIVMGLLEQWDWNQLREVARSNGLEKPSISYLGHGRVFNPENIRYAWAVHNEEMPDVKWLWRYEKGAMDWEKVMKSIKESDIALTAPNYTGEEIDRQHLDNRHNNEFAMRLGNDSRFKGPLHITMGRFEPIDIVVFVNSSRFHPAPQK